MRAYKDLLIAILTGSKPLTAKEIAEELFKKNHLQTYAGQQITQTQIRRVIRNSAIFFQDKSQNPIKYFIENKHFLAIKKDKIENIDSEKGFLNWLKTNQKQISRPDKYVSALRTISNDLLKLGIISNSLYSIDTLDELDNLYKRYFELPQLKAKNETGNGMYSRGFNLYLKYFESIPVDTETQDILDITSSSTLSPTEKETLVLARMGQGKFRAELIKICGKCAISGYSDASLLVASHIKPWRDSNDIEKLDPYNGLLLLPNYDKLFDKGLISFGENGLIMISPLLINDKTLNINVGIKIKLGSKSFGYMKYHRENVYNRK